MIWNRLWSFLHLQSLPCYWTAPKNNLLYHEGRAGITENIQNGDQEKEHPWKGKHLSGPAGELTLSETESYQKVKPPDKVFCFLMSQFLWVCVFFVGIDVIIYNFSIQDLICCFINVSTNHLHMSITILFIDHFLVLHFTLRSWWVFIFTSDVRTMLAPKVKMVPLCYCKR